VGLVQHDGACVLVLLANLAACGGLVVEMFKDVQHAGQQLTCV
jgi:hypothetical protein